MDNLKQLIENNREIFENEELPVGHKERFLKRVLADKVVVRDYLRVALYLCAASVVAFLILTPFILKDSVENGCPDGLADYKSVLKSRSSEVYLMADRLDSYNKDIVINTLDELVNEAIPFEDQLPMELDKITKSQLSQQYYCPKINGVEKLRGYVSQLLN
ncbi:MAG TPA: hypothetical protein DEO54_09185 [Rikenellaceae bacterium]|jgi:hypothetical protein|nr:MAG: hypothetical protein A2X20_05905 [Bacteroidetes bacterium GWE2_40_15]PKP06113.1 MAG: hypothetical protein CVU10_00690 [Bacteroidetes bacterium HGW-Bacteroidetes-5]HBZ26387.1 hypothetical protein [Rikenellaceae bacterium]